MSYPPSYTQCFGFEASFEVLGNFTVSQDTVNCLNLTQDIAKYVAAYCTNPPGDDDCPFDFCPNPEIAGTDLIIYLTSLFADWTPSGPLVRIASEYPWMVAFRPLTSSGYVDYVTTFCVGMAITIIL